MGRPTIAQLQALAEKWEASARSLDEHDTDHKGETFTRGHLVGSADSFRRCASELRRLVAAPRGES